MSGRDKRIRNLRGYVAAYFKTDAGKAALARKDTRYRDKESGKVVSVQRTNQMAVAFQEALAK